MKILSINTGSHHLYHPKRIIKLQNTYLSMLNPTCNKSLCGDVAWLLKKPTVEQLFCPIYDAFLSYASLLRRTDSIVSQQTFVFTGD